MWLGKLGRAAALLMTVTALVAVSGCTIDSRLGEAPLAVVLCDDEQGSHLTAVDLSAMEVVATHELRSHSYSMDGLASQRVIVTAQTGGVGQDADDAVGVWDLPADDLRYVKLPYPNPSAVAVEGSVAYVMHGFQIGDSLMVSAVDLEGRGAVTTGTVSEWAHGPESVDGEVYVPVSQSPRGADEDSYSYSEGSIERLGPSFEESRLAEVARFAFRLAADPVDEDALIAVGTVDKPRSGYPGDWRMDRIEKSSGRTLQQQPLALRYGVTSLCTIGNDLAIADANCVDLDDPGREIAIVDGVTLAERRRIKVTGTPAAVAEWRERLLVYDGLENELLEFDVDSGKIRRRLKLAGPGLGNGDMVVFDTQVRSWE